MLEDALDRFAAHLRAYEQPGLAAVIDGAREGDPGRLPQRVLTLFTHGMGGLLDVPIYSNGVVDRDATARRDELAHEVFESARARLGTSI